MVPSASDNSHFEWGTSDNPDMLKFGDQCVVDDAGQRLFLIADGRVSFPTKKFSKWLWTSIDSFGYINTNPFRYIFGIDDWLTSSDQHRFFLATTIDIVLRTGTTTWGWAAQAQDGLKLLVQSAAEEAASKIFREWPYRAIYESTNDVVNAYGQQLSANLSSKTPYELLNCRYAAEAENPSIDAAIKNSQQTIAIAEEWRRTDPWEAERIQRTRSTELSEIGHKQQVGANEADYRRYQEVRETGHRNSIQTATAANAREIAESDAAAEARIFREFVSICGSDVITAALLKHPNLIHDIRVKEIEIDADRKLLAYQTGRAKGTIDAFNALVRQQNLSDDAEVLNVIYKTEAYTKNGED